MSTGSPPGSVAAEAPRRTPVKHAPRRDRKSARAGMQQDDRGIIAAVRACRARGDSLRAQDYYRMLVERYQVRAYRLARQVLRNDADAEDVVQEAFVKAYLSLGEYKGEASFFTWFYRIVFNMSVDLKRKLGRDRSIAASQLGDTANGDHGSRVPLVDSVASDRVVAGGHLEGPEGAFERKEQRARIKHELDQISEDHRTVILLRDVDGLSYEEIARVVGISKGTVMSRLFYARQRLQRALRDLMRPGEE